MENLNIQFGQIPFWAICGFGERSKIEIVVFSAMCAKWFRSSEIAEISRHEILEITGLDKSQVSTAIKKLSKIGWIIQHSKTRWFIPANKQEKVDDSSTNLDTEKVGELTTNVDDFSTKVDESSTLYKETDLQTKQTKKEKIQKKKIIVEVQNFPIPRSDADKDLWQAFLESRQKMKLPLTENAYKKLCKQLEKLPFVDINERLIDAVDRKWQGLVFRDDFPKEQNGANNGNGNYQSKREQKRNEITEIERIRIEVAERRQRLLQESSFVGG